MKHTKGPWIVKEYPKVFSINAESGRQVAIMTEHYGDEPMTPMSQFKRSKQDEADAHLIAAAPEMLEALEHCIAYMEKFKPKYCGIEDDRDCSPYNDAIEAIRKAKGE